MIPNNLKIGAATYRVEVGNLPDGDYGNCDTHTQVITISDNQTAQSAGDTLLHEVLHAIWNESGLGFVKRIDEEVTVRITATWLRMVLLDNPELPGFILQPSSSWTYQATGENRKNK